MPNTLRIKRRASGATGAPASLANAELAYNEVDDILYYGKGNSGGVATTVEAIGGNGHVVNLTGTQSIGGSKTFTSPLSMGSNKITDLADPVFSSDAATKGYVDGVAQGLDIKPSVRAATTGNITLSSTQTIDGVAVTFADRVLVKNQTTASENGIYVVTGGPWVRASDMDVASEFPSAFVFVEAGTVNADTGWVCTNDSPVTVGTTAITFTQFSGGGAVVAGNGLTQTGNTLNVGGTANRITVGADTVDIASTYVGQTSITTLGTITAGTWNGTTIAVANGGTGSTTAAGARTNLGATTVGSNIFTLTNPSSISFLRLNADNTVSALDAASFRTAIGAGTGTVTSVSGTGTVSGLTLTGTVTTSGSLTLGGTLSVTGANFGSQTANTVLAAPNGSAGNPTFRTLVEADIPALTMAKLPSSAYKQSVRVATTANITLSGTQTIDGVAVVAGNRVLVKNQTTASQNGIYVVAAGAWTRALDADAADEIGAAVVNVDEGTANGGELWTTTFKTTDVLGTTAMNWFEVVYDSGSWNITAANVSGTVAIANGGTGATTAANARTNLGLGTIATQNANSVAITGGSVTNLTTFDGITIDGGTF